MAGLPILYPLFGRGAGMAKSTVCGLCGRTFGPYGGAHRSYCKSCMAKSDREASGPHRLVCKECGKEFSSRTRTVRYCSDECGVNGKRRVLREYMRKYMADPAHHARALARIRAAKAARRAREGGGKPRRPKPQSNAGRRAARRSPRGAGSTKSSPCGLCGRTFAPYGRVRHAYCKQCTTKADAEAGTSHRKDCRECGKEFTAKPHAVLYCSDACRASGKRTNVLEYRRRIAADPARHAAKLARQRAWYAAHKDKE